MSEVQQSKSFSNNIAIDMENSTKQQKPHQLRKEVKRLTESRNKLKTKNRAKADTVKNYQDRLRELVESRDKWKKRFKDEERNTNQLQNELHERENILIEAQAERDLLLKEFQALKKTN